MEQFSKYDKASYYHAAKTWHEQDARQDKKDIRLTAEQALGNNWPFEGGNKVKEKESVWLVRNHSMEVVGKFSTRDQARAYKCRFAKKCHVVEYRPTTEELEALSLQRREQKQYENTAPHRPLTEKREVDSANGKYSYVDKVAKSTILRKKTK